MSSKGLNLLVGSREPLTEQEWRELAVVRTELLLPHVQSLKYAPLAELLKPAIGRFALESGSPSVSEDLDKKRFIVDGTFQEIRGAFTNEKGTGFCEKRFFGLTKQGEWLLWSGEMKTFSGNPRLYTRIDITEGVSLDHLYAQGAKGEWVCSVIDHAIVKWHLQLTQSLKDAALLRKAVESEDQVLRVRGHKDGALTPVWKW